MKELYFGPEDEFDTEPDLEHPWYEEPVDDIKPGLDDIDDELEGLNSTGFI